jgi:membrane-associated phospholipid phosphatase
MKFSKFISYFFHPINFSIIGALLYFLFVPKYIYKPQEYTILIIIFIGTYLFPLFLTYLLKRFGMINSYHMVTIEERKFPTLLFISISFIIGNWLYKSSVVDLLSLLYFGFGLCLIIIYILLQFKRKISLHTAAIGGLIGFLLYFSYYYKVNLIVLFTVLFLVSGVITSARLKMNAHTLSEVLTGYILGISSQFLVYFIYSI